MRNKLNKITLIFLMALWPIARMWSADRTLFHHLGDSAVEMLVVITSDLQSQNPKPKAYATTENKHLESLSRILKKCSEATGVNITPAPEAGFPLLLIVHENGTTTTLKMFGTDLISPVDGSIVMAPKSERSVIDADRSRILWSDDLVDLIKSIKRS